MWPTFCFSETRYMTVTYEMEHYAFDFHIFETAIYLVNDVFNTN